MSSDRSLHDPLQGHTSTEYALTPDSNNEKYNHQLTNDDVIAARRRALAEIDNAKFGWFHIKACLVAGVGFFTDSYDIFAINLCSLILGYVYYADVADPKLRNKVPTKTDMWIKGSTQLGCIIGQFLFGYLADRLGRKRIYGVELMIIIVCTIGGAFAASTVRGLSVFWVLFIWRFILGIGIGGDYPVSAIITSEFATTKNRGAMIAAVFSMQGFGIVTASVVAIVVLACFKSAIEADQLMLDYVWRLIMGLGVVPGLVAVYFRLTIPETPRYTIDIEQNVHRAALDVQTTVGGLKQSEASTDVRRPNADDKVQKPSWSEFYHHFKQWRHFKVLMGTTVTWFALDVAYYGINLNSSIILQAIGFAGKGSPYNAVFKTAVGNIILNFLGILPGYWVTVFTIDRIGRKTIQYIGFVMLVIIFCILGFAYHQILDRSIAGFIVLFTLAQFFQNFGPNTTTFIIPAEAFPTRFRSTCHGISAAMGKVGAVISSLGFFQLKDRGGPNEFIPQLIQIFALFMLIGLIFTWFVPETKGKTLEELSDESEL